ncbi:LOW QUALITY PROTEIN: titin homolog [Drosophila serrata]|uniref:LOW QUALITY PROTEIN: titin homolog n=1 Tax=Drosophila serrata TaxID=7274 RepID=UPI000A1CF8EE|nr:LOW QUALITY PROTEIN: titin homolog [Drosophila serrata]
MMEVSQNVELKELSKEGALLRTISSDLGSDVEPLSTPAIDNKSSSRSSRDEGDLSDLTNGQDLPIQDVGKSITATEVHERNAGSDLDDLLDKISSIVDCSPKNLDDSPDSPDKSEECDSATAKEKTAGLHERQFDVVVEDEKVEEAEKEVLKKCENKNVELEPELESVKGIEEVIEDTQQSIQDKEDKEKEEDEKESIQEKAIKEIDVSPDAEEEIISKSPTELSTSKDDVFEDALDSISSSDEFDAFVSQDCKKAKPREEPVTESKPSAAEDLEEISSDEENIPKVDEVEKPVRTEKLPDEDVIDLDSSNECVVCETTTEVKESDAISEVKKSEAVAEDTSSEAKGDTEALEITVEETVTCTEVKEVDAAAKDTEGPEVSIEEETTVEESAELEALSAAKAEASLNKAAPKSVIGLHQEEGHKATEGPTEREPKSAEEPIEPMLIDDEESITNPKKVATEHEEGRTQTQERNDTTIDDFLMEVDKDSFESEEKKKSKKEDDAPVIISENDNEPRVNGVSENPTEKETEKKEKDKDESNEKIILGKETKENESDDEVIFFEPIDKTKTDETSVEPATEKVKPETAADKDDDVVLVSEDEDDEPSPKTTENKAVKSSEKKTASEELPTDSTAQESVASKDLLVDNTDNACDQFDKPKTQDKVKSATTEDGNSNSSSSNLLRPAENAEQPESKRLRLSVDEKITSNPEVGAESLLKFGSEDEDKNYAKRSHDSVERSPVQRNEEIPNKKLKTDDSDSNSSSDTLQIDLDAKDDTVDENPTELVKPLDEKELKLDLKPEPEIKSDVKPLRLDFLKNFRKSFDTLTRDDLEELVLQKVVEAMLVKSEFADIRTQLDKCESTLAAYRRKIAEVSKQFLDLDTVHKRVLKDLESKNSHFTAPVRITRAVGLQVGIPFKAMKPTVAVQDQSHAASSMLAPPSGTPPKASTSPMRSPMRSRTTPSGAATVPATATSPNPSTSPSPNLQQQLRSNANFGQPPTAATAGTPPVRRGCLQKITPQRPNPGASVSPANSQPNVHRLQASPPTGGITRGMHASKHTGSTGMASSAVVAAAAAKAAAMRQRNATNVSASVSAYMAQKQQLQQQQQQYQTHRPGPASSSSSGLSPGPAKQPKCTTTVHAQAPPISGATVSVPLSSTGGSVPGSYGQQPSLAPAKPKEKAVIDLTDEDDAAAAAAAAATQAAQAVQASIEANARLRQAANNTVKRNAQAAAATRGRGGRGGGNVVRQSPMQLARVNARQIVQSNGGGQRNSMGSNITMQIRSENTPPAASRLRYSHPAPLPTSPAQPFNPAWKMPPSRPVIRISLLDTGIVISWTLEDTSPRYADCVTYQIYAYQETIHEPSTDSWRHVGDVKAMLLPMAVTLNQFQENQRYYFAVRGVDDHQRFGPFSVPKTWS